METTNLETADGPHTQSNTPTKDTMARRFILHRHKDISQVSGTGRIAEGVQFHGGQCVLSWFGRYHTLEILPNLDTILAVHGHHGATTIEWLDKEE